jgi:UDP-3-O-[3-hydroxymyristoyl] glucosamine N-acyltransferase
LSNPRYTPRVKTTRASAIYVGDETVVDRNDIALLRARDPYLAYTRALILFHPEAQTAAFVHETAVIDKTARVADDAAISAHAAIGAQVEIGNRVRIHANVTIYDNVKIGADSVIHSGVAIRENSILGERVIVHNNAVIGCDGFGYAKDEERHWLKIPQTGRVVIEDDVEIGAGTTIDRASVGESRIARGTKIDNLVQVGHSCTIGEDTLLCAQVGLAGSSHIGNRVILAGQAGVAGHNTIGDDVVLTAKSATSHDVPAGKMISGIPAFDNRDWLRSIAAFRRLGEIVRTLRGVEKRLDEIEKKG